jgi:hypothetical protein
MLQTHSLRQGLKTLSVALTSVLAAGTVSCGKDVTVYGKVKNIVVPKGPNCDDASERLTWQWNQPDLTFSRSVDLLFVTDSSLSLVSERKKLARAISHFLRGLPKSADPRIAVMLGHGGKGKWSGRLFAHGSDPKVLDPSKMSEDQIVRQLEESLTCPKIEFASTNGEALFLSLQKSLRGERFNEIRSQGFFRDGAAISVVFVSDENEVCFDPRTIGLGKFPNYKPSWFDLEERALKKYCSGITPESTFAALREAFPGRKVSIGAIVHSDPAFVPECGEDSIGHGYLQLASKLSDSLVMDIRSGDFDQGLSRLASVSTSQLSLQTAFDLGSDRQVDERSILVRVDGNLVPWTYDSARQVVQIAGQDAGVARSQIDISACPVFEGDPPQPPPIALAE